MADTLIVHCPECGAQAQTEVRVSKIDKRQTDMLVHFRMGQARHTCRQDEGKPPID